MTNFIKFISFLLLNSILFSANAQFGRYNFDVFDGNDKLDLALVGGLIAPQFSEIDLNQDGIQDLYIFDKAGEVSLTFINNGTANEVDYVYAPQYEKLFPDLKGWVLLRDYNGDDVQDIFSYSDFPGVDGVIAYTGKIVDGNYQFERYDFTHIINSNVIPYPAGNGFTQVYLTSQDYPAFDDIDGDGDLDILTFAVGGGHLYLYNNESIEMGYGKDSLIFTLSDICWGRLYESGINEVISLSDDITVCSNGFRDEEEEAGLRHAGSTILTFDNDQDGDMEVLLGDISFNNLNLLTNGGDTETAFMIEQDTFFPSYNLSADVPIFPASFYIDVNNDGVKDLLASPNVWKPGENYEVVWRYQNNGQNDLPDFQFLQKDFLVNEMINIGKEAHPTFVDYNADGLLDMVVGNNTYYRPFGERASRLVLFENIGTANNPKFELVDGDYLGFSVFDDTGKNSPAPTFGDIDGDGDMDILIGEESGGFYFGENIAGEGNPINIPVIQPDYMGLDLGVRSSPQLVDLNRDGKLDIVAGDKGGKLVYFQNEGTATEPMFIPNIDSQTAAGNNIIVLGLVDTKLGGFSGYAAPFFYDFDGEYVLFCGSEKGRILKYSNIDGNLDGDFTLDTDYYGGIRPGFHNYPCVVDINNDNRLEIIVGNARGGLTAYRSNLNTDGTPVSTEEILLDNEINIFPNPASTYLNVELISTASPDAEISIFNTVGQLLYTAQTNNTITNIPVNNFAKGLIIVQVKIGSETLVRKVILK